MTRGDVLQIAGFVAVAVGLFLVLPLGWALAVLGALLLAAGELIDRPGIRTNRDQR